jgi:hypothetical protein
LTLGELKQAFFLNPAPADVVRFEAIAFEVAAVDLSSSIDGTTAKVGAFLTAGLDPSKFTLGYRVFSQGAVVARHALTGDEFSWTEGDVGQVGTASIEVPGAAVLHCIATYAGIAQHFGWLADPRTAQNPRRVAYETMDQGLAHLVDVIEKAGIRGGYGGRELEPAVASLAWMLGFSVAHMGNTPKLQDGPDLIATTPQGHFALIECTTSHAKSDKLSLLHGRVQSMRRRLDAAENRHLRVLPVMVTTKSRTDLGRDLEQAASYGVWLIDREGLDDLVGRSLVVPNADQIFEQAELAVRSAQGAR